MNNRQLYSRAKSYAEDLDYDEYVESSWEEFLKEDAEKFALSKRYSTDYTAKFLRAVDVADIKFRKQYSIDGDVSEKFYTFITENSEEFTAPIKKFAEEISDFEYKTEDEFYDDAVSGYIDGYIDYVYERDKELSMI